jgi:hypothetical protein
VSRIGRGLCFVSDTVETSFAEPEIGFKQARWRDLFLDFCLVTLVTIPASVEFHGEIGIEEGSNQIVEFLVILHVVVRRINLALFYQPFSGPTVLKGD